MAVPDSLILASEVLGFISFAITLLTALGVYADLIRTLRGAPSTIPIALGNLREELQYEQRLCKQSLSNSSNDEFHILPSSTRPGRRSRHAFTRLLSSTLRHLWTEFCDIERRFLLDSSRPPVDAESPTTSPDSGDEKHHHRHHHRRRRSHGQSKQDTYVKSRMGVVEAGLSHDKARYYSTDLAHRMLWWWKKDDVENVARQLQRLQIRRIERDAFEANALVKRGLRLYARERGRRVDDLGDDGGSDGDGNGGGSGSGSSDGGGGGGGVGGFMYTNGGRQRQSEVSRSRMNGRRNSSARRGGVREVSEKEVIRRRARSPANLPLRRSLSVASAQRERPPRRSVVYEYEIVDPGGISVEYADPRDERWREGHRRRESRGRRA